MASRTFHIGAANSASAGTLLWTPGQPGFPTDLPPVDPILIDGGGTAYVRRILFGSSLAIGLDVQIQLAPTNAGTGSEAGPDFTTTVETQGVVTLFNDHIPTDFEFDLSLAQDSSDPYLWTIQYSDHPDAVANWDAWKAAYDALTDAQKEDSHLIISDGTPVVSAQAFHLGDYTNFADFSDDRKRAIWNGSDGAFPSDLPPVRQELVEGRGTVAYLRYLRLEARSPDRIVVSLFFAETNTAGWGAEAGPDLSEAFETNGGIRLEVDGLDAFTLSLSGDTSEPYSYAIFDLSLCTQLLSWLQGLNALTDTQRETVRLILSDGPPANELHRTSISARATGTPSATLGLGIATVLSLSAIAGTPTASLNAEGVTLTKEYGTQYAITSGQAFAPLFSDENVGASDGNWRYVSSGSSSSGSTGPGSNNALGFMHTETSGGLGVGAMEANGIATLASVPDESGRSLLLRLCIQGEFGDGSEGLEVQYKEGDSGAWTRAELITGWDYSNSYTAGQTITDENGVNRTCAANGGWIDFSVDIPNAATSVRLQPRYTLGGGQTYRHDIALRSLQWCWTVVPEKIDHEVSLSATATGSPSATLDLERIERVSVTHEVSLTATATGTPIATANLARIPRSAITFEISLSARAGAQPSTNVDANSIRSLAVGATATGTPSGAVSLERIPRAAVTMEVSVAAEAGENPLASADLRSIKSVSLDAIAQTVGTTVGATTNFTSASAFTGVFPSASFGTSEGRWRSDSSGSSSSSNTGPGSNNALSFVHTETSFGDSLAEMEGNGRAAFGSIPDQTGRTLTMRLCIQGAFGNGSEGLQIEYQAGAGGAWQEAGFAHGWDYSDSYTAGQTITDENGVARTCAADGGWIDFDFAIPDAATSVRISPRYVGGSGSDFHHDVAVRSVQWRWGGAGQPPSAEMNAEIIPRATATHEVSLEAEATGSPSASIRAAVIHGLSAQATATGVPIASADLARIPRAAITHEVSITATATGTPSSTVDLERIPRLAITHEVSLGATATGTPSATLNVVRIPRAAVTHEVSLSARATGTPSATIALGSDRFISISATATTPDSGAQTFSAEVTKVPVYPANPPARTRLVVADDSESVVTAGGSVRVRQRPVTTVQLRITHRPITEAELSVLNTFHGAASDKAVKVRAADGRDYLMWFDSEYSVTHVGGPYWSAQVTMTGVRE